MMKEFGSIHPRDINYRHIRRLRNTIRNLKQRTIRTYLNRLGKMLEFFYGVNPYRQADVLWSPEATERDWIFKAQWKELWNRADETERLHSHWAEAWASAGQRSRTSRSRTFRGMSSAFVVKEAALMVRW